MNQTEDELAKRLAKLLDQGADELAPGTADRLAAARREALAHHRREPAPAWSWVLATSGGPRGRDGRPRMGLRLTLLAAFAVAVLALALSWQTPGGGPEIADIDAALLTDELPINAYLDQRLDSWLKRGSR